MKKLLSKIISFSFCLILICGSVPTSALSVSTEVSTDNNFNYIIECDTSAIITGYTGSDTKIEIPSLLGGKPVEFIGRNAFSGSNIEEVTFSSTIKYINPYAFKNCTNLKNIKFNNKLETVGSGAFANTALCEIIFPRSLKALHGDAFSGCADLKTITFDFDYRAEINFSDIGEKSFGENTTLIFKGLPSVDNDITLRNANYTFYRENGDYCYKPTPEDFTSPDLITNGDYTYRVESDEVTIVRYNNFEASEVTIPETIGGYPVTKIEDFAFSPLSSVGKNSSDLKFGYSYKFKKATVPETVKIIGRYAFAENDDYLCEVILPDSLSVLSYCAFSGCGSLEKVNIPNSIDTIPDFAFAWCILDGITVPDNVKIIGRQALNMHPQLNEKNLHLSDNIEYLGPDFLTYNLMTEFKLPDNLKILDGSLEAQSDLEKVIFNNKLEIIGEFTFTGCEKIKELTLPDSVIEIGDYAFGLCKSLERIYISENVTRLQSSTFHNCASLNEVIWNSEKKQIDEGAFSDCVNLKNFDFSKTDSIIRSSFINSGLESVTIGKGKENEALKQTIGEKSFMLCDSLTKVEIGGNVDTIASKAFANCNNLKTVVIDDSVKKIAKDAFDNSENVTFFCWKNSYAEYFAIEQNIKVTTLVIDPIPNQTYTSKEIKPELSIKMSSDKLEKNSDYEAVFSNNINVGTANVVVMGKGEYSMLISKADFAIVARNIADVHINKIPIQVYKGNPVEPQLRLKYNGKELKNGKDFIVTYENNNSPGTGTVRIKGTGNFKGSLIVNIEIKDNNNKLLNLIYSIINVFISIYNLAVNLFN